MVEIESNKVNSQEIGKIIIGRYEYEYGWEEHINYTYDSKMEAEEHISKEEYGTYTILEIYQ